MKILGKRVLVRPVDQAIKTDGGIYLPDRANDVAWMANQEGVVVAIGAGIRESTEYTKGTHVFIAMYESKELEINGIRHLICPQSAIVGISVGHGLFHPIGERILVRQISHNERLSLIVRPSAFENDRDSVVLCQVHLVGSGVKDKNGGIRPFMVKKGDMVYVESFSGRDVEARDGVYMLITEGDVIGISE